jgi:hypothetical protein
MRKSEQGVEMRKRIKQLLTAVLFEASATAAELSSRPRSRRNCSKQYWAISIREGVDIEEQARAALGSDMGPHV